MTLDEQIIKAGKATAQALRAVRDARNASQLQHGGANFSKTTDALNTVADQMAELYERLELEIAASNRSEVQAHSNKMESLTCA